MMIVATFAMLFSLLASPISLSCRQEQRTDGYVNKKIDVVSGVALRDDSLSRWELYGSRAVCSTDVVSKVKSAWVVLDSGGYDSLLWINSNLGSFCQDFRLSKKIELPSSNQISSSNPWLLIISQAQPWYSAQSKCDETEFGYPLLPAPQKDFGWFLPKDTVLGAIVFQLIAGTDTVYNSIPFRLSGWVAPIQPQDIGRSTSQSLSPIRRPSGFLFPSSLAAERFIVFTPQGRRVQVQEESTSEGVMLHVPKGRGLLVVQAGSQHWKLMR